AVVRGGSPTLGVGPRENLSPPVHDAPAELIEGGPPAFQPQALHRPLRQAQEICDSFLRRKAVAGRRVFKGHLMLLLTAIAYLRRLGRIWTKLQRQSKRGGQDVFDSDFTVRFRVASSAAMASPVLTIPSGFRAAWTKRTKGPVASPR